MSDTPTGFIVIEDGDDSQIAQARRRKMLEDLRALANDGYLNRALLNKKAYTLLGDFPTRDNSEGIISIHQSPGVPDPKMPGNNTPVKTPRKSQRGRPRKPQDPRFAPVAGAWVAGWRTKGRNYDITPWDAKSLNELLGSTDLSAERIATRVKLALSGQNPPHTLHFFCKAWNQWDRAPDGSFSASAFGRSPAGGGEKLRKFLRFDRNGKPVYEGDE